jgi:hypothetical protein
MTSITATRRRLGAMSVTLSVALGAAPQGCVEPPGPKVASPSPARVTTRECHPIDSACRPWQRSKCEAECLGDGGARPNPVACFRLEAHYRSLPAPKSLLDRGSEAAGACLHALDILAHRCHPEARSGAFECELLVRHPWCDVHDADGPFDPSSRIAYHPCQPSELEAAAAGNEKATLECANPGTIAVLDEDQELKLRAQAEERLEANVDRCLKASSWTDCAIVLDDPTARLVTYDLPTPSGLGLRKVWEKGDETRAHFARACTAGDAKACAYLVSFTRPTDGNVSRLQLDASVSLRAVPEGVEEVRIALQTACRANDWRACRRMETLTGPNAPKPGVVTVDTKLMQSHCTEWRHLEDCWRASDVSRDPAFQADARAGFLASATAACRGSDAEACEELGDAASRNGDRTAAQSFYERACDAKQETACESLASLKGARRDAGWNNAVLRTCEEGDMRACELLSPESSFPRGSPEALEVEDMKANLCAPGGDKSCVWVGGVPPLCASFCAAVTASVPSPRP